MLFREPSEREHAIAWREQRRKVGTTAEVFVADNRVALRVSGWARA